MRTPATGYAMREHGIRKTRTTRRKSRIRKKLPMKLRRNLRTCKKTLARRACRRRFGKNSSSACYQVKALDNSRAFNLPPITLIFVLQSICRCGPRGDRGEVFRRRAFHRGRREYQTFVPVRFERVRAVRET